MLKGVLTLTLCLAKTFYSKTAIENICYIHTDYPPEVLHPARSHPFWLTYVILLWYFKEHIFADQNLVQIHTKWKLVYVLQSCHVLISMSVNDYRGSRVVGN